MMNDKQLNGFYNHLNKYELRENELNNKSNKSMTNAKSRKK